MKCVTLINLDVIFLKCILNPDTHRIHGAAIYGNMDPITIPPINVSIFLPAPAGSVMGKL